MGFSCEDWPSWIDIERAKVVKQQRQQKLNQWIAALSKASSALRFAANQHDWYTNDAKSELKTIAEQLSELETELALQVKKVTE